MAQEHGHHQHRGNRMHHVGQLHGRALIDQARKKFVQHQARRHHHDPQHEHTAPENHFFTRIEPVRRWLSAGNQAATLEQPIQIAFLQPVVAQEGEKHNHQRHSKQRPGKVVHGFERKGQPAEQGFSDHREDEKLPKSHDHPRDGQNGKSNCVGPVRGALEWCETLDLATRVHAVRFDGALGEIKNCNRQHHNQQERAAVG